jgi:tetratricopeptide (TPR) repeat protein
MVFSVGCQINRSFAPMSPSQIIGSERGRQGISALERGNLTEAEKRLEDAVKLNKNDINHRRYYAEVLWQQEKYQEALLQLNEAVKRGGQNNASLHISLAEKYLAIREYSAAYQHADEAVRLESQNSRSWALRGKALWLQATQQTRDAEQMTAMLRQAREDYLRAVPLAPQDRELLAELAAIQMRCGQPEQAWATWQTVQSLYPQGSEPAEVLFGKAETLTVLRRFDEARANLTAIRQRGTENPETEQKLQAMMAATQGGNWR